MNKLSSNKTLPLLAVFAATSLPALAQKAAPQPAASESVPATSATATAPTGAATEFAVWLDGKRIVIPTGTAIKLQTEQKTFGKHARVDDALDFSVVEDVLIDGIVVFKKGAPAKGVISFAKGAKNWNKGGKLELDVLWTTAADGRQIPTLTRFKESARNDSLNQIMNFGLLSPFSKGKSVNIKKGAKYDVVVGDQMAVPQDAPTEKSPGKAPASAKNNAKTKTTSTKPKK